MAINGTSTTFDPSAITNQPLPLKKYPKLPPPTTLNLSSSNSLKKRFIAVITCCSGIITKIKNIVLCLLKKMFCCFARKNTEHSNMLKPGSAVIKMIEVCKLKLKAKPAPSSDEKKKLEAYLRKLERKLVETVVEKNQGVICYKLKAPEKGSCLTIDCDIKEVTPLFLKQIPEDPLTCKVTSFSELCDIDPLKIDEKPVTIGEFIEKKGVLDSIYGKELIQTTQMSDLKVAVINGYPSCEIGSYPTADHALYAKHKTEDGGELYIYSGADGCGWGQRAAKAGRLVNFNFIKAINEQLKSPIANLKEFSKAMLQGLARAQFQLEALNKEIDGGSTTHVGIVAKKDSNGKTQVVITTLGDMKVFLRKANGKVIEITRGNRGNATNASDPGGRFHSATGADLRNLSLFTCECESGDVLLPMSDGVHDNLDPARIKNPQDGTKFLYQTPQEAYTMLRGIDEENLPPELALPKTWKEENVDLGKLKDAFMEFKVRELLQDKKAEDMPVTLINHVLDTTAEKRTFMVANPSKKEPDYPGKTDHISCGMIQF